MPTYADVLRDCATALDENFVRNRARVTAELGSIVVELGMEPIPAERQNLVKSKLSPSTRVAGVYFDRYGWPVA